MRTKVVLIVCLLLTSVAAANGQRTSPWANWSWMIGNWSGVGSGEPGKGKGEFSFTPDLNAKVLLRRAHSEYPAAGDRPASIHDDLMIVYLDDKSEPSRAIYFDNEGHTINYSINYAGTSIVMLRDKVPQVPIFRLTYTKLQKGQAGVKFEMSTDGKNFTTYVEGVCKRIVG